MSQFDDLICPQQEGCPILDLMKERYNTDMTALGRRLLQLEFGDKAKEVQDRLDRATKPEDLVVIRKLLER